MHCSAEDNSVYDEKGIANMFCMDGVLSLQFPALGVHLSGESWVRPSQLAAMVDLLTG